MTSRKFQTLSEDTPCDNCKSLGGHNGLHSCPYQEEVARNPEPYCNCCVDCMNKCEREI